MDIDDGIKCTLIKFSDNIKLSGTGDTAEERDAPRKDLNRLENFSPKQVMTFSKIKCIYHSMSHKYQFSPKDVPFSLRYIAVFSQRCDIFPGNTSLVLKILPFFPSCQLIH